MKFVPNAVTTRVARQALVTKYHSPKILFIAGVAGFAGTVVLASRATLKVDDVLAHAEKERMNVDVVVRQNKDGYNQHDAERDLRVIRIKTTMELVKLYAPPAALGALSIAALTGSHHILTKRNAAVTAAYATIEKAFNEYRQRVRDEFGDDKDRHLRHGVQTSTIAVDTETGTDTYTALTVQTDRPLSGYAKFFDQFNRNWEPNAELNLYWLKCQQQWLNDKLKARGHLFLNEVYEELGFEHTKAGAVVGWWIGEGMTGDGEVDFGIFDANNAQARDFVNGKERAILLDFNVDGVIYNYLSERS